MSQRPPGFANRGQKKRWWWWEGRNSDRGRSETPQIRVPPDFLAGYKYKSLKALGKRMPMYSASGLSDSRSRLEAVP